MMRYLYFIGLSLLLIACQQEPVEIQSAFYYWKNSTQNLSDQEKGALSTHQTKRLYVKFFEIEPHAEFEAIPVTKLRLVPKSLPTHLEIIPTVFIRNEVFKTIEKEFIDSLAIKTQALIQKYYKDRFADLAFKEIQIDCDWTEGTKAAYFQFLQSFKKQSHQSISVTLRLYPYKFSDKMGVPPVDRAMLMCYNLLSPLKAKDKSSILDIETLNAYLHPKRKYPLDLDIALPIFSWMQFYHYDQFQGLIYPEDAGIKSILFPTAPFWYKVKKDTSIGDLYLRAGDKVKYEEVLYDDLKTAIALIKKNVSLKGKTTIALFHLDDKNLNTYATQDLSNLYTLFQPSTP